MKNIEKLLRHSYPLPKLCRFQDIVTNMMNDDRNHAMEFFVSFTDGVLKNEEAAVRRLKRDLIALNKRFKREYALELWFEYSKQYRLHCHGILYGEPLIKNHFNKIAHTFGSQHYVKPITDLTIYTNYCREFNNKDKLVTPYNPILHACVPSGRVPTTDK